MAKITAYAIHTIGTRINGVKTSIPASTKQVPSVFITTEEELAKLEPLGAARLATEEEIAVAKIKETVVDATNTAEAAPVSAAESGDEKPESGAKGDPSGNKKAAKAASGSEEI